MVVTVKISLFKIEEVLVTHLGFKLNPFDWSQTDGRLIN